MIEILVNPNSVEIEGWVVLRPKHIPVSRWMEFWERLQVAHQLDAHQSYRKSMIV